jgi:hypothetical protein
MNFCGILIIAAPDEISAKTFVEHISDGPIWKYVGIISTITYNGSSKTAIKILEEQSEF